MRILVDLGSGTPGSISPFVRLLHATSGNHPTRLGLRSLGGSVRGLATAVAQPHGALWLVSAGDRGEDATWPSAGQRPPAAGARAFNARVCRPAPGEVCGRATTSAVHIDGRAAQQPRQDSQDKKEEDRRWQQLA